MLLSLNINNLVIIEKTSIELVEGFNVITGETGSGKSVLLDCLSLCFGGRNNHISVMQGAEKGSVIAEFDISKNMQVQQILSEHDMGEKNNLIIRRSFTSSGRSQIFLNDEPVSLNLLKEISPLLLEMYGQHDFSNLLDKSGHIEILDEYAESFEYKNILQEIYSEFKAKQNSYKLLKEQAEKIIQEEEYLRFILSELEKVGAYEGEESELVSQKVNLQNSKNINDTLGKVSSDLSGEGVSVLYQAQRSLLKLSESLEGEFSEKISKIVDVVERSSLELEDAQSEIDNILSNFSNEGHNLEEIEDRLHLIREMARKHRKTPDELAEYTNSIKEKLSLLDSDEHSLEARQKELEELRVKYLTQAKRLSKLRTDKAKQMEEEVLKNLPDLKMKEARFTVEIVSDENNISSNGIDVVTFKASINPGQNFTDISKTASGGELSRLMLAMKIALSKNSNTCVIFDEIDTGISGATAEAVGVKLKELSKTNQVICITHQPQVASKADSHYLVFKQIKNNLANVSVSQLDKLKANEEVARLISGEKITDEARAAAEKLKVS